MIRAGHDLESLLFNFLNEFLYFFSAEPYFIPKVSLPTTDITSF